MPEMVTAAARTIFASPTPQPWPCSSSASPPCSKPSSPTWRPALTDAREDLLAVSAFPLEHWRKV